MVKHKTKTASASFLIGCNKPVWSVNYSNVRFVYGLPQSSKQLLSIRVQTRLYIRPLVGDAISWPSMYAHSGSSKGQWAL